MKTPASFRVFLALLLCLSPAVPAQPAADCDQLRGKIQRLEGMNLNDMSPSIRQVYKEALHKLYAQFNQCLQQDISAVAAMQSAVAGTDAAAGVEERLRALTKEKADTDDKLSVLRVALNIPDNPPPAGNGPARRDQPETDDVSGESGEVVSGMPPAAPPASTTTAMQQEFPCLPPEPYDDAPELLTDIASKAADGVVQGDFGGDLSGVPQMMTYSTIDAASPTSSALLRSLKAYQYFSETARTDKQLGASASSEGSVSAIEKPGFARLLGFAVEHGAIDKENDGTSLTLSTSLYSLYTLNREDNEDTYRRAGVLNRIGVFTTFAVDNQDDELANARRNNLSEWSVKARLFGDRSTRSPGFQRFWDTEIRPLIRARLEAVGGALDVLTSGNPSYQSLRRQMSNECLPEAVKRRKKEADYEAATAEGRKTILTGLLLGLLKSNVYDRVKAEQVGLTPEQIAAVETRYVPRLSAALASLKSAEGELKKRLDDLNKGPLGTFAYTNHRRPMASDYSETKFLWEQDKSFLRPLKLTGNFGLSLYHRPDAGLRQEKLRDVSAALSFEGTSNSPFTEAGNMSKVTYSFVGRYERLFENRRRPNRKPDIAVAQFAMEVPFFRGFSLPLSLSYANATEEERKKNVRFNFGFRMDTDKLIELLTSTSPRH